MPKDQTQVDWLALIKRLDGATRGDLMRETGLSGTTVAKHVNRLVAAGEVEAQRRRWGNGTWFFVPDED